MHGYRRFQTCVWGLLCMALAAGNPMVTYPTCVAQTHYGIESASQVGKTAKPYAPQFFGKLEKLTRFGMAISNDGRECYYAVALREGGIFREEIRFTRKEKNGSWTKPQPLLPDEKKYKYVDPHFSPDGNQLFFIYTKPADVKKAPKRQMFDIWQVQRNGNDWGTPQNLGAPFSTSDAEEYYVSMTSERTIFFGSNRAERNNFDLYSARLGKNGQYEKAQPLPGEINTAKYEADVFVASDESYVIFSSSGRKDSRGQGDLYVSFKDSVGNWSKGINLGDRVNTNRQEFAPSISRDQKVLFFSSGGVIHWVSTSVIDNLKPQKKP